MHMYTIGKGLSTYIPKIKVMKKITSIMLHWCWPLSFQATFSNLEIQCRLQIHHHKSWSRFCCTSSTCKSITINHDHDFVVLQAFAENECCNCHLQSLKLLLLTTMRFEHSWASTQESRTQNFKSWKFKDGYKLQHKDDVHKIKTHELNKLWCNLFINTWRNVSSNIKIQTLEGSKVIECKFVTYEPLNF